MIYAMPMIYKSKTAKDTKKATASFVVTNDKGIHARPATELVKCATLFKSTIILRCHEHIINAKSILGILMLAATKGTEIDVEASGDDAQEAVQAIIDLAKDKFHIAY